MKQLLLLLLIGMLLTSCDKKVDFGLPGGNKDIVMNALMNPDSVVYVRLTLLNNNLATSFTEITDGVVSLYEDNVYKETLSLVDRNRFKFYKSKTAVLSGKQYTIKARVADKELEATDVIPENADIADIALSRYADPHAVLSTKIQFSITDQLQQRNFYRFRVLNLTSNPGIPEALSFKIGKTVVSNNLSTDNEYKSFFTDDVLFDGEKIDFSISLEGSPDSVLLEVTSLSQSSYQYLKSAARASEASSYIFEEVTPVYNNIKNGLGIVGGIATRKFYLK